MSNTIRVLLWTILSLGMIFIAMMAFWAFLLILGVFIAARMIYLKLSKKNNVKMYTRRRTDQNQNYTTVIDADDPEKEYHIPKIK
ncbi:MAG: hypothetical protein GX434_00470 [Peptococcaceae bacterium]|nr:hypothetical protein [Peptococcaceae bacterium]